MPPPSIALTEQSYGPNTSTNAHVLPPTRSFVTTFWTAAASHFKHHFGVGIVCAVAYFDPGNWCVDLQAGSNFGYRPMLFVVLMAGLGAIVLQTLSCRLGCVTGTDLASHCRLLLHDHPHYPRLVRFCVLYPLYVVAEIAIIATDLAELLGSAIGICLIFPRLPLWAGVILTAVDVLAFLAVSDPSRGNGRPVRSFEVIIIILVLTVFTCFVVLLVKVQPTWSLVFVGYIPSKSLFQSEPDAVYSAVGILGATIMPHALFLGSFLATQDRLSPTPNTPILPTSGNTRDWKLRMTNLFSLKSRTTGTSEVSWPQNRSAKYGDRENNSFSFISNHLVHAITDVISSLLLFALPINSAILILAATVFYDSSNPDQNHPAGLFEAHDLISRYVGKGAAFVFALALVFAGQTSGITATLAGQIVSEGFVRWSLSPFLRRLITRLIGLIPSVIVAIAVGRNGLNSLLVTSQVILSMTLPFVAFPLIYLTSSEVVMRVRKPLKTQNSAYLDESGSLGELDPLPVALPSVEKVEDIVALPTNAEPEGATLPSRNTKTNSLDYSNGLLLSGTAYSIWLVVLLANLYGVTMLARGKA